jgi:chromosome partitioning protein
VDHLSIIPSHISLSLAERELGNKPFRETLLDKKLRHEKFILGYDVILLDCPPTLTTLTINAMFAADLILIPVTYAKDALEGVGDLFELLSEIKDGHDYRIQILRNQFDARKKTANGHVAEKLKPFINQGLVLNTIIRQDEEVNKASFEGLTVMVASPNCNAATDYNNLRADIEVLINE